MTNVNLLLSQNRNIVIADQNNGFVLPYATIKILNKSTGYYSDSCGYVSIPDYNFDSVLITYSGYVSCKLIIETNIDTIYLKRKEMELPNIVVTNFNKLKHFGIFKYKKSFWASFPASLEYAVRIDLAEVKGYYKLKEIFLPLGFNKDENCNCKLHLYKSDVDGQPAEDILNEPIIINKKTFENQTFTIDISKQNLFLDERILFIGIECILYKKNVEEENISDKNNFKRARKNSPIFLYFNGKNQFFDTSYNHTFIRILESKKYGWTGSKNAIYPPRFSAGLVILSGQ